MHSLHIPPQQQTYAMNHDIASCLSCFLENVLQMFYIAHTHTYIYIYILTYIHIHTYIYIYNIHRIKWANMCLNVIHKSPKDHKTMHKRVNINIG